MVNTSMLTVVPGTPLYRAMEKGLYTESTETEKLEEIYELVRCLTNDTIFMNEHASNFNQLCHYIVVNRVRTQPELLRVV